MCYVFLTYLSELQLDATKHYKLLPETALTYYTEYRENKLVLDWKLQSHRLLSLLLKCAVRAIEGGSMHHSNVFRRNFVQRRKLAQRPTPGTVYKLSEIVQNSALNGCHYQNFPLRAEEEGEKVVRTIVVDDSKEISFSKYNRTDENSNLQTVITCTKTSKYQAEQKHSTKKKQS